MSEGRRLPAHRFINVFLARGVGQMIVAANNLRHAHVMIIDDDGEHVGRRAIGAQQHEIVDVIVGENDAALHGVLDHRLAIERRFQTDHRRHAGRRIGGVAVAPAAIIARRTFLGARQFAHLVELLLRGEAAIGLAARQ